MYELVLFVVSAQDDSKLRTDLNQRSGSIDI